MKMQAEALELSWWIACSVLLTEVLYRLPWGAWIAGALDRFGRLLGALLDSEISDDERERRLQREALGLLVHNLKGVSLIALFSMLWVGLEIMGASFGLRSLLSLRGAMILSISSLFYFALRIWLSRDRRTRGSLKDGYNYSPITQSFYGLALDHPPLVKWTFKRERARAMKRGAHPMADQPVWVCGLARAGTTILTELLYDTELFVSLTYRDMPFPLAPRAWRALSRLGAQRAPETQERAHGDGLLVSIDSPEALEEVFWRTQDPHIYQESTSLTAYQPSPQSLERLRDYIGCVLWSRGSTSLRYLSKNNNHLLRLPALIKSLPRGKFLIPLRDPLSHADSLRRQHLRWIERHERDPFSRRYMDWLCHHEFGSGHRPFKFTSEQRSMDQGDQDEQGQDTSDLNYWILRWIEAYRSVQELDQNRILVIDYTKLNEDPKLSLQRIAEYLEINLTSEKLDQLSQRLRPASHSIDTSQVSPQLLAEAQTLYQSLLSSLR